MTWYDEVPKVEICNSNFAAIHSSWLPEERRSELAVEFARHPAWKGGLCSGS